ncbi:MAG TPA: hypothetical protein VF928_13085 [Usitatibacteraceae bacterium]
MKPEITHRPRALAAIFATALTSLTLTSFESLARPDDAHPALAAAGSPLQVAPAAIKLEPIVVIGRRLNSAARQAVVR